MNKYLAAAVFIALFAYGSFFLQRTAERYMPHTESKLFESVSEARAFQNECLTRRSGHALVAEEATGIQITCEWQGK